LHLLHGLNFIVTNSSCSLVTPGNTVTDISSCFCLPAASQQLTFLATAHTFANRHFRCAVVVRIINNFLDDNEINWQNCIGLCADRGQSISGRTVRF
jgi:hypothetical protein